MRIFIVLATYITKQKNHSILSGFYIIIRVVLMPRMEG